MKVVLQRVLSSHVTIEGKIVSEIKKGYTLLLGVEENDTETDVDVLVQKIVNLRIANDESKKMNKSILDINGEILVVSQFTLVADTSSGRRPSFLHAAKPEKAKALYEYFVLALKKFPLKKVANGEFGAYMEVSLVNDGPVTILLESKLH